MTILKCKNCRKTISTIEHIEDKKNYVCGKCVDKLSSKVEKISDSLAAIKEGERLHKILNRR